jgi:hypothetical protein
MAAFRLVEFGGGPGGPVSLPRLYATVDAAADAAERLLDRLAGRPHRRPHRVDVIDVWTRETIVRVTPHTERDPDVCVACGQPNDPFAPVLPFPEPPAVASVKPSSAATPGEASGAETETSPGISLPQEPSLSLPGDPDGAR